MRGVNATRRVVLHLKSVTEHASLRESQTARDLERNGNAARQRPVQVCIEGGVGGFQVCIEGGVGGFQVCIEGGVGGFQVFIREGERQVISQFCHFSFDVDN